MNDGREGEFFSPIKFLVVISLTLIVLAVVFSSAQAVSAVPPSGTPKQAPQKFFTLGNAEI
ncbi:MAG TPA: hypothetical protein PLQ76_07970, partial [bacterium]|nr:hypothetical protein [bacterium]